MESEIINKISKIREQNNRNWMNILKLAFANAPEQAKVIMKNITDCDAKINKLMKDLCK